MEVFTTTAFTGEVEIPLNFTDIPSKAVLSLTIDIDAKDGQPVFVNQYEVDFVSFSMTNAKGIQSEIVMDPNFLPALVKDHKAVLVKAVFELYAKLISEYNYRVGEHGIEAELKSQN